MKKTFEGTINGQKFDSVAEYNKYMLACLAEGKKVEASAYTKIDEEEKDEDTVVPVAEMTPSFENDNYVELDRFDKCNNENEIHTFLSKQRIKHSHQYAELMEKVGHMNEVEIKQYLDIWNHCNDKLQRYDDVNKLAYSTVSAKIRELESNLSNLNKKSEKLCLCQEVINQTRSLYQSLIAGGTGRLSDLTNEFVEQKEQEETTSFRETSPQKEQSFSDLLKNEFTDEEIQKAAAALTSIFSKCI